MRDSTLVYKLVRCSWSCLYSQHQKIKPGSLPQIQVSGKEVTKSRQKMKWIFKKIYKISIKLSFAF